MLALAVAAMVGGPVEAKPRPSRRPNPRTGMAPTPYDDLVKAVKRNDRGAIERVAARLGPARLFEGIHNVNPTVVLAVLSAVPRTRGSVVLAGSIADLTASSDPAISAAAARAVGKLLAGDVPNSVEEWEVPPDTLSHACGALQALALRPDAPRASRLAALEGVADAVGTCGSTENLAVLLKDTSPVVRRAAALLLRPWEKRSGAALRAAGRDPDPGVAAAAVAVLCRNGGAARRNSEPPASDAVDLARVLIVAPATPIDDAVEMMSCLGAARTAADRKLLADLRQSPHVQIRDSAGEVAASLDAPKPQ